MNLSNPIQNLSAAQLNVLHSALALAGIVYGTGGDYQQVFRLEKNLHPAASLNRIFRWLQRATGDELEAFKDECGPLVESRNVVERGM